MDEYRNRTVKNLAERANSPFTDGTSDQYPAACNPVYTGLTVSFPLKFNEQRHPAVRCVVPGS